MEILRVLARWTGFNGAPGYSAFHFAGGGGLITDAQQVTDRVWGAFDSITSILPEDVTIRPESVVTRMDSDTGEILGFESVTQGAAIEGGISGNYSAATGAVVNWNTNDVRFGRRIRGRTFLVPLAGSAFDTDGSLNPTTLGFLRDFGNELVGGDFDSEFGVWSRPKAGTGGVFATATNFTVPDMAAVLRSRRD